MTPKHEDEVRPGYDFSAQSEDDRQLIQRLSAAIYEQVGGKAKFNSRLPGLIRQAVDEVIDPPRSRRFKLEELEKTEKTYLGTKIEILLRDWLGVPKGQILDLLINETEVDVKNTIKDNWQIPHEAVDRPCLLVSEDEKQARFSIGLIIARKEFLSEGKNQDGKKTISAVGKKAIHWLLKDAPYPKNFWEDIAPEVRNKVFSHRSGTSRVDALFRYLQKVPISRSTVLATAQQLDAMKRLRKNGGARDSLALDGIELLSGKKHAKLIEALNLPACKKGEFISFAPATEEEKEIIRKFQKN